MPHTKQGQLRSGCSGPHPAMYLQGRRFHSLSGHLFQYLTAPRLKAVRMAVQLEFFLLQLVSVASHPTAVNFQEESGSVFSTQSS